MFVDMTYVTEVEGDLRDGVGDNVTYVYDRRTTECGLTSKMSDICSKRGSFPCPLTWEGGFLVLGGTSPRDPFDGHKSLPGQSSPSQQGPSLSLKGPSYNKRLESISMG